MDKKIIDICQNLGKELNIEPAVVYAIIKIESGCKFVYNNGIIPLLYERHLAYKYVKKMMAPGLAKQLYFQYPSLFNPHYGGYGRYSFEHKRLKKAEKIINQYDVRYGEIIPYYATSMGAFQILGYHHKMCGYKTPKLMYEKYKENPMEEQIESFIKFLKRYKNGLVIKMMQKKDWQKIALYYNGKRYKMNKYDKRLEKAYKKYKGIN